MQNYFTPSIILNEALVGLPDADAQLPRLIERIGGDAFFGSIEIGPLSSLALCQQVGQAAAGLLVTQWLIPWLRDEQLSLCALQPGARQAAVVAVINRLDQAVACGAARVGIWSGPDPGAALRAEATAAFRQSLATLAAEAAQRQLCLVVEPFDREAHKKGLIGPSAELTALLGSLAPEANCLACWDAGHLVLGGESGLSAFRNLLPCLGHLHLSNCILEREHPGFGDWHIRLGGEGFLSEPLAQAWITTIAAELPFGQAPLPLAVEVRREPGQEPWEVVTYCQALLSKIGVAQHG